MAVSEILVKVRLQFDLDTENERDVQDAWLEGLDPEATLHVEIVEGLVDHDGVRIN
jgi:hypothetical protein